MADFPFDPKLPTNNDGHAEVPRPSLDPDPEVRQPSTWAPTSDEERRIFRVWKDSRWPSAAKIPYHGYGITGSRFIQNIPTMDLYAMCAGIIEDVDNILLDDTALEESVERACSDECEE